MESETNDYQLEQGGKEYIFSTSIVGNSIRLSCKDQEGKIFSRDFTVYELKSLSPIFNEITSESDAINFIEKVLSIHKVGVHEESNQIKITFYINIQDKINQVDIPLGISGGDGSLSSFQQFQAIETAQNNFFENPPNIGPVAEDINTTNYVSSNEFFSNQYTNIEPSKNKIITNPPKFLPLKIIDGDNLNVLNQINQYNIPSFDLNQAQTENINYLQNSTNLINTTSAINTISYDTTQYMISYLLHL